MKTSKFVTEWVVNTIRKEYPEDIALVVSHSTLRIDDQEKVISYFVPITERGHQFGRTFILEGTGFDIWGIEWERMERFADLEEYNITCLADGELLYARTPEDRARFEALQNRLAANLDDPLKMRKSALEAYVQAKNLYFEMSFAQAGDIRMCAGYIFDYLSQAIAFSNHRYFHKCQTAQMDELAAMEKVPEGFIQLYQSVILNPDADSQKKCCQKGVFSGLPPKDQQTASGLRMPSVLGDGELLVRSLRRIHKTRKIFI